YDAEQEAKSRHRSQIASARLEGAMAKEKEYSKKIAEKEKELAAERKVRTEKEKKLAEKEKDLAAERKMREEKEKEIAELKRLLKNK
ncbi:MAG: hypothetical protein LBG47_09420, partial [Prevotellaceae bacterium]|nr:hypothetical protein [Prevotellaceae bacterium]